MAKYNEADIINEVKIILTENENVDSLKTEGMDDISLERDTLIAHLIPAAINRVIDVAPEGMLKGMSKIYTVGNEEMTVSPTSIVVPISNDIAKIIAAKVSGWHRQLHSFYTDESEEYSLLHCRYPSWTPSKINPIGFFTSNLAENDNSSDTLLELMPGTDDEEVELKLKVLLKCTGADKEGYYYMTEDCFMPLVYMIAGMYYNSMKESQMSQNMTAIAVDMLGQAAKAAEQE